MRADWPRLGICLLAVMCAAEAAKAAPATPNPALAARVQGVDDEMHRRYLPMTDLNIDMRLVGSVARTTLQIHFANPTDEQLEGELSLALPDSAVVIGYALDVEDAFIEGVLAEPSRARAAYEARVRERVDPGLAEVSRSNVFSTRVYPIDEQGRTIRMTFVAPVHSLDGWTMPLVTDEHVEHLSLSVRAEGVTAAPELALPEQLQGHWQQQGNAFVLQASSTNQSLSGELRLKPPALAQRLLVTTHPNGRRFFQLNDRVPVDASLRSSPERVRIYWDRSRSRQDDALETEIDLLTRYLETMHPGAIDVVSFNSSAARVETFTNAAEVRARLQQVLYRGATSFAMLDEANVPKAETCLLFSDGVATIDSRQTFQPHCDVFAVTSATDADIGYLAQLMGQSAAAVLRLDRSTADDVLARLRYRTPAILDVRDASGTALSFASLPAARGDLAAVGEVQSGGEIVVRIAGSDGKVIERRYRVGGARQRFEAAGALWAADQVLQLAARERRKELLDLSRRFGVASPHLAFVVLERPWDYVQARISPPANYPTEWREAYDESKAEHDRERRTEREEHLADVIERWEEQKQWWEQKRVVAASPRLPRSSSGSSLLPGEAGLEEVAVTGMRVSRPNATTTIELAPWNIDRPYLKALEAAENAQLDSVLAAEEKVHGELPVFYLDVAEWFHRRGESERATELLLSALELPATNDETLSIVAARLARYGQFDRAIWLNEQLIELAPDRPQPVRSLALALTERAKQVPARARNDLQRAVSLLNHVVTTPWDEAYDGIELIALMEANALIPRLKKLGIRKTMLDQRLIALLDVDLRVTIEWNTPATDLDLWVTEPNGERSMYSNPNTAIGGHLSNDMTAGFGPEEYLLRRAPDGRFEVEADVYSADALDPNGVTTLTARLTHNFGRSNEHTEVLDIELHPEVEGAVPLGSFVLTNHGAGFDATAAP